MSMLAKIRTVIDFDRPKKETKAGIKGILKQSVIGIFRMVSHALFKALDELNRNST